MLTRVKWEARQFASPLSILTSSSSILFSLLILSVLKSFDIKLKNQFIIRMADYQHFLDCLTAHPPFAICRHCFSSIGPLYSINDISEDREGMLKYIEKLQVRFYPNLLPNTKIQFISPFTDTSTNENLPTLP